MQLLRVGQFKFNQESQRLLQTRLEKLIATEFFVDTPHKQRQHRVFDAVEAVGDANEPRLLECSYERLFRREWDVSGQFAGNGSRKNRISTKVH